MNKHLFLTAILLGVTGLAAQETRIFSAAQAEAGRKAFQEKGGTSGNKEAACAYCHTTALTGRTGAPDEFPVLSSLEPALQKTVENYGKSRHLQVQRSGKVGFANHTRSRQSHQTSRRAIRTGSNVRESCGLHPPGRWRETRRPRIEADTAVEIRSATQQ
jgi:cytochrome c553